jgi:hypothetical protein
MDSETIERFDRPGEHFDDFVRLHRQIDVEQPLGRRIQLEEPAVEQQRNRSRLDHSRRRCCVARVDTGGMSSTARRHSRGASDRRRFRAGQRQLHLAHFASMRLAEPGLGLTRAPGFQALS